MSRSAPTPDKATSSKRSIGDLIADAEAKGSSALGDANEAAERGAKKTAEKLYQRAQRWLDRANKLRGWN